MGDEGKPRMNAEGKLIAQAMGPGSTANAVAIEYAHVRPTKVDPAVLAEARRLLAELPLDRVPDPGGMPAGSKPPPMRPNRLLVGRDEDLKALAAKITDDANGPATVAVSGIGGVGKTQLVGEFAHRYGRYFAGGVFWLNLSDPESIKEEVAACGGAGAMDLRPEFHTLPLEARVAAVMGEFHGDLPRLVVLDDCADGPTLDATRPKTGGCRVLATARGPMGDPALGVAAVALDTLDRGASVELLRAYRDGAGANDEALVEVLDEIAAELGDLPLALDLAGRYLRRYRHITDPGGYLRELRSADVLDHPSLRGAEGVSPTGHVMDVGRTFVVSLRRLDRGDETDRLAIRLLARAARFAPGEPIDRRLLLSALGPEDEGAAVQQRQEREEALLRLVELGLVGESEAGPVRMHKLVAEFASREVEDAEAQADVERAVADAALEAARSGRPVTLEPLMPHLRHAVDAAGNRDIESAYLARFALGLALLAQGYPTEAVPHLRSGVEYNAARLRAARRTGPEHDDLLWLVMRQENDLAVALERAGDRQGALAMHEVLLEERRANLPQPHEDVASTLLNIGKLQNERGLLHEVGPRYEEALAIREAVLARMPADHPERRQILRDLAESHGNLGAHSMGLGRPREAALSYRLALEIYEGLGETEHERYANTSMAHGAVLGLLGDFGGARRRLERALRVNRRILWERDDRIVKNLILLGALLAGEAGRGGGAAGARRREILAAAREHLGEALDLLEGSSEGPNPLAAGVEGVAAGVAEAEGRRGDAGSLRARSDAVRTAVFLNADPGFIGQGTEIFAARGIYREAELYGRRALELRRSAAAGPDLEVAEAEFALGRFLLLVGRGAEAAPHLREALGIREAILGPNDPATALVRECLAHAGEGEG